MARLIDADALPFMSDNKYDGRKIPINRVRKWIENAPTVEAIPIEWIEMRVAPLYWDVEGRQIQEIAYWLIDEWREEGRCSNDERMADIHSDT